MNLKERRALCDDVREYIATSGATVAALATKFNVPYQTMYSISKGTNSNPSKRVEGALRRRLVTPWEEEKPEEPVEEVEEVEDQAEEVEEPEDEEPEEDTEEEPEPEEDPEPEEEPEEDTMPGPQDLVAALSTIRETCTCYSRCNVCPMYSKPAGGCGLMAALPSKWVLNQPEPVWRAMKTEEEEQ